MLLTPMLASQSCHGQTLGRFSNALTKPFSLTRTTIHTASITNFRNQLTLVTLAAMLSLQFSL